MAARAIRKIVGSIAAESSRSVMTVGTVVSWAIMFPGYDICHLAALSRTWTNGMTLRTAYALAFRVVIMPKNRPENIP